MSGFTVEIDTFASGVEPTDSTLGALVAELTEAGGIGPVVGVGGVAGGIGATFGIDEGSFDLATRSAIRVLQRACRQVGLPQPEVAKVSVLTHEMSRRELEEAPETYLGLAEVARELGVSRQRVAELRRRPGFPAPVAELAAGPVWRGSTLRRFLRTWDRRPGRRPRAAASGA